MSTLALAAGASGTGSVTIQAPATNNTDVINLPDTNGGTIMVSSAMPAFSAYNTGGGSISASTATKISYDTKTFDTNTCFNNTSGTVTLNGISTPSYSFAPNVAGYYLINGSWCTNSASAQNMNIELYKNGSLYQYSNWQTQNSGLGGVITGTFIVYLNGVSDYVSMYVVDSIAVGTTSGSIYTYFQGSLLRAA